MTTTPEADWFERMSAQAAADEAAARVVSTRHRVTVAVLESVTRDYQGNPDEIPHAADPLYLACGAYVAAVDEAKEVKS